MEAKLNKSPKKAEFQMRSEEFPALVRTTGSEQDEIMSGRGGIMGGPNAVTNWSSIVASGLSMSRPSGIVGDPSEMTTETSGITSRLSRVTIGSSGVISKPSGKSSSPSGITISETRTCSFQVEESSAGFPGLPPLSDSQLGQRTDIQINPDGTVTNIPPTMMADQFGLAGFLSAYRGRNGNPSIATLNIGEDPISMGLGMNSELIVPHPSGHGRSEIHLNYGGPWANRPDHAPRIEARIPEVYKTNFFIGGRLAKIKFRVLEEDSLFYIFYSYPGEAYQIAAAYELHKRDWRFHKVDRVWVRRLSTHSVTERTTEFESGTYTVFVPELWRKMPKKMTIQYKDLSPKPELPSEMESFFKP